MSEELRLEQVSKWYGDMPAVADLDLTVPEGQYVALLGPSGCGKTTTLRMVAGFERPTSGRVLLGGRDLTELRPHERPVNTVFQSYALFPHLDVLANVAFGPRRRRLRDADARSRAALELVELSPLARRRPAELSGGEQQRVALARALVNDPAVLLLDEPLGALDLRLRRAMQDGLKNLQRRTGTTFLHVTHDQEEALTLADQVAVLRAGRLEQLGSPREVYESPRTAFVATFLGRALLAPARPVERVGSGDGAHVRFVLGAAGSIRVPVERVASEVVRGAAALVGIRPERVRVHPGPPPELGSGHGVAVGVGPGLGVGEPSGAGAGEERSPYGVERSPYGVDLIGPALVAEATYTGPGVSYRLAVEGLGQWQVLAANDGRTRAFAPGDVVHLALDVAHAFAVGRPEGPFDHGADGLAEGAPPLFGGSRDAAGPGLDHSVAARQ